MKVSYLSMTSYEGPAPGIEIWPAPSAHCDPKVASDSCSARWPCAHAPMRLGFDWVSVSEHHYAPYIMTPNPVVMAAAVSQIVKRAKLALLGPLIPLNNPIRMAEEVAMLDSLSGGRVVVLFLRGTPNEQKTFDTTGDTRAMTQEGIDLIVKAWTQTQPFAWKGENYRFETVSVWPRPRQDPHPPIFGSGNSEESVIFAARRGMGIGFSFAPPDVVRKWIGFIGPRRRARDWRRHPNTSFIAGSPMRRPTDAAGGCRHGHVLRAGGGRVCAISVGDPRRTAPRLARDPALLRRQFARRLLERFATLRDCGVGRRRLAFGIGTPEQKSSSDGSHRPRRAADGSRRGRCRLSTPS